MDNQEAIRLIRNLPTMCGFTDAYGEPIDSDAYYEAVDMAISALKAQEAKHSNESSSTQKALDTIQAQDVPDTNVGDMISRQAAIDEIRKCRFVVDAIEKISGLPSAQPEWNNHTVACLLAELFDDTCACNYNGIDEWLPEKCELLDSCPNPVGVACWEQYLKHRAERRSNESD